MINQRLRWSSTSSGSDSHEDLNFLDGCQHVFLDVGSNIGIQIRKLYEPQLFPGAFILPVFNSLFGNDR